MPASRKKKKNAPAILVREVGCLGHKFTGLFAYQGSHGSHVLLLGDSKVTTLASILFLSLDRSGQHDHGSQDQMR